MSTINTISSWTRENEPYVLMQYANGTAELFKLNSALKTLSSSSAIKASTKREATLLLNGERFYRHQLRVTGEMATANALATPRA
jgi:hypothetical protein